VWNPANLLNRLLGKMRGMRGECEIGTRRLFLLWAPSDKVSLLFMGKSHSILLL